VKVSPLELRREDISDLSKGQDIERLFRSLNTFGASANQALKSGLTFTDNLQAFVKEIDFTMGKEGISPSLTAPWALYAGEAAVDAWKSDAAIVQLEGRLAPTGAANPSACMTLPKEFWPHRQLYYSVDSAALLSATANVSTAGVVTIGWAGAAPAWVSLAGIIYMAADHRALPNPGFPVTFTNELAGKAKPLGCWVWQAWDMTDQRNVPVTAGAVAWELSSKGDQIVVRDIANLPHERKYKVRLVVVAG
jgi:hypothetical protein